ncbi:hypothetical protein ER308_01540 [Egibacter rhizosphaerae]|uniref:DUF420 domain-containing protein n=1 Tax=Egibacter rhizosphaerae TaxID=1670831 RepID=A0A411YB24_9ACTN|nr:hypothetical protein [Egibacter rhizosphaerae]QBI18382.1 hypothetical protein ER308_01540 [Egibacter rhizosphaerae]
MSRVVAVREPIWWGAVGAITVLSSMHVTIAFAAIYLAQGAEAWPPAETPLPAPGLPLAVVGAGVLTLLAAVAAHRRVARDQPGRLQAAAAVVAVLLAISVALSLGDLLSLGYDHTVNAFASAYWVNVGLHAIVAFAVLVAHAVLALRHWAPEEQLRLRNAYVATLLLTYYVAVGWGTAYAVLHLVPRYWVGGGA